MLKLLVGVLLKRTIYLFIYILYITYSDIYNDYDNDNNNSNNDNNKVLITCIREIGAGLLIDDNPVYCLECSDAGVDSILFNYENQYPWSQLA